jgi:hypothetical protein
VGELVAEMVAAGLGADLARISLAAAADGPGAPGGAAVVPRLAALLVRRGQGADAAAVGRGGGDA